MDIYLFKLINGLANSSKFLDFVGIFFAEYFQYFLGLILVVLLFWPKKDVIKNRIMVMSAVISVVLSRLIFTEIIRFFYHRARPYVILETAKKLIAENQNYASFPSGHAAFFFALAMGIYLYNKKLGIWYFVGAVLMGLARIFVGVHWPSDILGGALVGIISGVIVSRIIRSKTRVDNQQPKQIFSDTQSL
jgi:undecaprenyl-diphosphatase